jgi:hypothetical protein
MKTLQTKDLWGFSFAIKVVKGIKMLFSASKYGEANNIIIVPINRFLHEYKEYYC